MKQEMWPFVKQVRQALRHDRARTLSICAAVAVTALLTACSTSLSSSVPGGPSSSGATAGSRLLAFSQCMRSNGLPGFPDPSSDAKFPDAQQLGVAPSLYQTAYNACQRLLPAGAGGQIPPAEVPQILSAMREFSQCMRSHGIPNWPDPTVDAEGQPVFDISGHGITRSERHSPQVENAMAGCQHLLPSTFAGGPPLA